MTRTLYLHVGPPKTGSTSIQVFIRDNAATFHLHGLYRPTTGTERLSHVHRGLVDAFKSTTKPTPLLDDLASELEQRGLPERVFVSSELFAARLLNRDYIDNLKSFCRRLGYRLHVIAYIRPQVPLFNSLFTQHVKKWRDVISVEKFLEREIQSDRHNYQLLFLPLQDDPEVSLTIRPFNRATLASGLFSDISNIICPMVRRDDLVEPRFSNVSPGPRTVAAMLRIRKRITAELPELDPERMSALTPPLVQIAGGLGWNGDKFGGMTTAQQNAVAQHFAASNEILARRVWSKTWNEIFTDAENAAPPYNFFTPSEATPQQRREFRDYIEQSMETIAEFASIHQIQPNHQE